MPLYITSSSQQPLISGWASKVRKSFWFTLSDAAHILILENINPLLDLFSVACRSFPSSARLRWGEKGPFWSGRIHNSLGVRVAISSNRHRLRWERRVRETFSGLLPLLRCGATFACTPGTVQQHFWLLMHLKKWHPQKHIFLPQSRTIGKTLANSAKHASDNSDNTQLHKT